VAHPDGHQRGLNLQLAGLSSVIYGFSEVCTFLGGELNVYGHRKGLPSDAAQNIGNHVLPGDNLNWAEEQRRTKKQRRIQQTRVNVVLDEVKHNVRATILPKGLHPTGNVIIWELMVPGMVSEPA